VGILTSQTASSDCKEYMEEFYQRMGTPPAFEEVPLNGIIYKLSNIDEYIYFKKLFC